MKLPFGKYRGRDIRNVPKEYLMWVMSQPDMLPDMREDIQQVLDKYDGVRSTVPATEPKTDSLEASALIVSEGKVRILRAVLLKLVEHIETTMGESGFSREGRRALEITEGE